MGKTRDRAQVNDQKEASSEKLGDDKGRGEGTETQIAEAEVEEDYVKEAEDDGKREAWGILKERMEKTL
ncbi:hypothetical protein BWQ96_00689 [Gracilariopsis chorda]|uniref:Uncharacterized protein n=1 Tax=Gracilariopsis chorda TaxID=448386 RepID=A0A2V3J4Y0_9FLOR|nr:hypothetical protein BWQ96_00689 [Gracilariopsis chorda]|eukprot:PXF49373.1 hypothetical protein BWQ96_00689 [Gracilariopsis chorda]